MGLLKAVLWDMDGTLIDSEPLWHAGEIEVARANGGTWDEALGWQNTGKSMHVVSTHMIEHGTQLDEATITAKLIDFVFQAERRSLPWVPGAVDVLRSLASAGIPSILVTASPERMATNLLRQAPEGVFAGYVSSSDNLPKKPDPAPYLAAGQLVDEVARSGARTITPEIARAIAAPEKREELTRNMERCIAIDDSEPGLQSAAASGALTLAQTAFIPGTGVDGPQFAAINGYDGVTAETLKDFMRQRMELAHE